MFTYIAFNVITPIFVVMGLGFLLSRSFRIDLPTLSKLNFYVFIPVFMFYGLLIFKPGGAAMEATVVFNLLLSAATFFLMAGLTRWLRFKPDLAAASTLSVIVFNSANYGIPVIQLAFQGEGVGIQVITITVMNVLTYTLGLLIVGGWREWRKGLQSVLKLPILYALAAALAIRGLDVALPDALIIPLKWTSDGMLPVALLTLGAQLGQGGFSLKHPKELILTVAFRLLFCPLLAYVVLHLMGVHGLVARVLFVSSAFPTAVATVLLGLEYRKEPTFMADVVGITTLLSALTVTAAISLSTVIF